MKNNCAKLDRVVLTLTLAAFVLLPASAQAQQAAGDTLYFNNGAGGNGTWQDGAGGTTWADPSASANVNWDNTVQTFGVFNSTPGTVTVNGTVDVNNLEFDSSYTLNSGTISKNGDVFSGGNADSTIVTVNNSNVTINSNIIVNTTQNTDQYDINNFGTGTVTYNGNITYTGTGIPRSSVLIDNTNGASTTILNGTFSNADSDRTASIWIRGSDAATLVLNGDYTGLNTSSGTMLAVQNGTAILGTSKTGTGAIQIGSALNTVSLLTSGAQNIANPIVVLNLDQSTGNPGLATIGGKTADVSTYSGTVNGIVSGIAVTAAADGRVNFTNTIFNNIPTGIIKTGAGTVNLSGTNTYGLNIFTGGAGTVAADIQQGTLLIHNGSGSAFGNNSGTVKVEAGATLGGNGTSTQQVVAVAASSIIAPGDAGQANLVIDPTTGILHLTDGLAATSGLTLDFKIDGSSYDQLDLGSGDLTLGGVTTVNFTNLSTVLTGPSHIYTFASGSGAWSNTGSFVLNAPAGYTIASDTFSFNQFNVEFAAVPEPSVWALMLGGFAFLGFCVRRKNRTV